MDPGPTGMLRSPVAERIVMAVVVVGIVVAASGWDRYRSNRNAVPGIDRWQSTGEVFVDPESGPTRVWYDPPNGQRAYRADR